MKDQYDFSVKIIALQLDEGDRLSVTDSYSIDRNQIVYRAEGNANIVLSLVSLQKVIRLPKYDNVSSIAIDNNVKDGMLTISIAFLNKQTAARCIGNAQMFDRVTDRIYCCQATFG